MKVFKLAGLFGSLLCSVLAASAQNPLAPGQLPAQTTLTKSSFDSALSPSPTMPKQNFTYLETKSEKRMRLIWIASIAAMTAGTALDAYSSWHKQEGNSFLASSNGTFGGKAAGIKAGIAAGVLTPQIIFRKRRDWHMAFAISNFAEASIFTGAAIHNLNSK
jgi:hypothetical protein